MQTDAQRLADIQLGRNAAEGMERAIDLIERKVRNRFARLQSVSAEMKKLQAKRDERVDPSTIQLFLAIDVRLYHNLAFGVADFSVV